jgi:hypothetical protein
MYAKMPKHCIDPPTPMVFDRSEAMTARTGPRSRDEGVNLISGNSRLEALDQVLAIIMGEAKVGLGRQIRPFNIADDRRLQISRFVNTFELHRPIHRGPLAPETSHRYSPLLDRPPTPFCSPFKRSVTVAATLFDALRVHQPAQPATGTQGDIQHERGFLRQPKRHPLR